MGRPAYLGWFRGLSKRRSTLSASGSRVSRPV